jgi:hypothetical protein
MVEWWQWVVVAIWGPATVAVIGLLSVVVVDKARKRVEGRRPVLVDRRQPDRAWLRDALDVRGVPERLISAERELTEITTVDRRLAEDIRPTR